MSSQPIRLMVVDDHTLFRQGLSAVLGAADDIEVVGEASNGEEAVARAAELMPSLILMDIQMPELNGIEATRRIAASDPEVGVIVLTMFEDDDSVFAAMRAGARGYILKGADQAELLRAVRAVAAGEALFGPSIARRLITFFASGERERVRPFPELTDREREVLALVASGSSNSDIARKLVVSQKTVRNHISNIFNKLAVADRSQAIVRARQAGLAGESPTAI